MRSFSVVCALLTTCAVAQVHPDTCTSVVAEDPESLSLLQMKATVEKHPRKINGHTASLDEKGYQAVADLKDNEEMQDYIRRVSTEMGFLVGPGGGGPLNGFTPFFSGVKSKRNYNALKAELQKAIDSPKTWLIPNGANADLDEEGFESIAKSGEAKEMADFVTRLTEVLLDMEVTNERGLKAFVPFYNGDKGHLSYDALKEELIAESSKKHTWLGPRSGEVKNEGKDCAVPCAKELEKGLSSCPKFCGKGNPCSSSGRFGFVCTKLITGGNQPLNEAGFGVIQNLKDNMEMEKFVHKVATTLDFSIKNDKALKVLVTYYSGTKDSRSYDALLKELKEIGGTTGSWIVPRGTTASLDEEGFQTVAKLSSEAEMAKFIDRAAQAQGNYVKDKKWLKDIASFYMSQKKDGFKAMLAEVKNIQPDDDHLGRLDEIKKPEEVKKL